MSTRRAFIVGAGSALTLPIVSKFEWFIRNEGRPLIEVPRAPVDTLFVGLYSHGQITLGPDVYDPPRVTWREYITENEAWGELPTCRSELREICNQYSIEPESLDSECHPEFGLASWARTGSAGKPPSSALSDSRPVPTMPDASCRVVSGVNSPAHTWATPSWIH